jgi:hypothetical protein
MKKDEIGGTCRTHSSKRNAYIILVRKPERNMCRPWHRWVDIFTMDLKEIGLIGLA